MKVLSVLGIVAMTLFLSACNPLEFFSDQPSESPLSSATALPSPSPTPLEACDLIQSADLTSLLGQEVSDPEQSRVVALAGGLQQQSCLWVAANGEYTPSVSLTLTSQSAELVGSAEFNQATDTASLSPLTQMWSQAQQKHQMKPRYEVIAQLGADAFWSSTELYVYQGNNLFSILVSASDAAQNKTVAIEIGRQVLRRLPTE